MRETQLHASLRRFSARRRYSGAALREAFFGNREQAKRLASAALELSHGRDAEYGAAFALALSEDFNQAEALADDLQRRFPEDTWVRFHYVPAVRMTLHPGDDAATEFRKILDQPGLVATDPIGALARLQLGRAYVQSGDVIRAKAAYTDFLNSWKGVDQELSILQQAQVEWSNAPDCDKSPSHSLTRD